MKFATIVSFAAFAAVTNADMCNITLFEPVLAWPETIKCSTSSNYMVVSLKSPTEAQMGIMCSNTACKSLLSKIKSLAPEECQVGEFSLHANMIDPVTAYCKRYDSGSSDGSSATSNELAPNTTPSEVTGSESKTAPSEAAKSQTTPSGVTGPDPKTPTLSNRHSYSFAPDTLDDTSAHPTNATMSDATKDTTNQQTTASSDVLDDTPIKQISASSKVLDEESAEQSTASSKRLDDTSSETTSDATSVCMTIVLASVFMVIVTTTIF